jgi:predicted secreted protein
MPSSVGPQNGRNLGIFINNSLIAYAKTCSLSLKANSMDVTSKDSLLWAANLPTSKNWTMSTDGLVAYDSSRNAVKITDLLIAGTKVVLKFAHNTAGVKTSSNVYWWGYAYVIGCDQSADMDSPISFTASFQGTSTLNKATMT